MDIKKILIGFTIFLSLCLSKTIFIESNLSTPYYIQNEKNLNIVCLNSSKIFGGSGFIIYNSQNITIKNCNIKTLKYGVFVLKSNLVNIENNTIEKPYIGIYIKNSTNINIKKNNISSKKYTIFIVNYGKNITIQKNKFQNYLYQIKFGSNVNVSNVLIENNLNPIESYTWILILEKSKLNNIIVKNNTFKSKYLLIIHEDTTINNMFFEHNIIFSIKTLIENNVNLKNIQFLNNYYMNMTCIDKNKDGFCENQITIFNNLSDKKPLSKYFFMKNKSANKTTVNKTKNISQNNKIVCTLCNIECCNIYPNITPNKIKNYYRIDEFNKSVNNEKTNNKKFTESMYYKLIELAIIWFITILMLVILVLKIKIIYHLLYE